MRQAGERVEAGLHRARRARRASRAQSDRRHGVLAVVPAAQRAVARAGSARARRRPARAEARAPAGPGSPPGSRAAAGRRRAEAERVSVAARGAGHRQRARVAPVRDRDVAGLLAREEAGLRGGVGVDVRVAVEVVGGDVQDRGDAGAEAVNPLELERGELERRPTSARAPESTCSQSGVPRFPPVKVGRWRANRAPASAVVVLFPLVPVMPTTGVAPRKRAASSTSRDHRHAARRARPGAPGSRAGRRARPRRGRPARGRRGRGRRARRGRPRAPRARGPSAGRVAAIGHGHHRPLAQRRAAPRRRRSARARPP